MKSVFKAFVLVLVLTFTSCIDESEVVPTAKEQNSNEKELYGVNKGDATNPNNDGGEDPDDSEVN